MPGQGRMVGTILLAIALIVAVDCRLLCYLGQVARKENTVTGAILGILLVSCFVVLPLGGGGIYLLTRGRQEQAEYAENCSRKRRS